MGYLARQVCKELVAGHAAVERQQVEESVHVHLALHTTHKYPSFRHLSPEECPGYLPGSNLAPIRHYPVPKYI